MRPSSYLPQAMWGNTILTACENYIVRKSKEINDLEPLAQLLDQALKADLSEAIPTLAQQLKNTSALTKDITQLITAFPAMVQIIQYGNSRNTNINSVEQIIEEVFPRITSNLLMACVNLEDTLALERYDQVNNLHQAIHLLNNKQYIAGWHQAIITLESQGKTHALLKGLTLRLIFDRGLLDLSATQVKLKFALSEQQADLEKAFWIEGFLKGSGLLLIHNPSLWQTLDEWIQQINMTAFKSILPLLRRTFASFSEGERKKMLALAQRTALVKKQDDTPKIPLPKRSRGKKSLRPFTSYLGFKG